MSNLLGLDASAVKDVMNATNDADRFQYGSAPGQYPEAKLLTLIDGEVEYVCDGLPEKYRSRATEINGDIICDFAQEGQTKVTLSLTPATTGTIYLYKNWPLDSRRASYDLRTKSDAMDSDEWALSEDEDDADGTIVLVDALTRGEKIYADYKHTAFSKSLSLRSIALMFIQAKLIDQLGGYANKEARVEELRRQAYSDISKIRDGRAGLYLIDNLKLVAEYETRNETGLMQLGMQGGYLG